MSKISVIVPNYNHAQFLKQRIQSIVNQTYQDFEIICLDDASVDNSAEILAEFQDNSKIRIVLNKENSGSPFKQWNKGIKCANGEYIWIAESDDYSDLRFLEVMVMLLDQYPSAGIAYCQSHEVDTEGTLGETLFTWTDDLDSKRWHQNFMNIGLDECKKFLAIKNTIPNASAVIVRKSVFEKINLDESMTLCGDWMAWIKILLHSDIVYTSQVLNYYRTHSSTVRSKSGLNGLHIHEKMQVISFILEKVKPSPEVSKRIISDAISEWVSLLLSRQSHITITKNFEIYRMLKKNNKLVEIQFIRQFIHQGINDSYRILKRFSPTPSIRYLLRKIRENLL